MHAHTVVPPAFITHNPTVGGDRGFGGQTVQPHFSCPHVVCHGKSVLSVPGWQRTGSYRRRNLERMVGMGLQRAVEGRNLMVGACTMACELVCQF